MEWSVKHSLLPPAHSLDSRHGLRELLAVRVEALEVEEEVEHVPLPAVRAGHRARAVGLRVEVRLEAARTRRRAGLRVRPFW